MEIASPRQRRYQLLVFDWDGTLSDSLQLIIESVRRAVSELGLPPCSDDSIRGIIGLGLVEAWNRLFPGMPDRDRERLASQYRDQYRALTSSPVPLYPGAAQVIRELHAQGYNLAVATGKSRRGLDRALAESGLAPYFEVSRCADETFSKPHPQMLQDLMDLTGATPEQTLMIGDSEHDMQMARNAGVDAVALSHGALPACRLLEFGPKVCLEALHELPPWLDIVDAGAPSTNP